MPMPKNMPNNKSEGNPITGLDRPSGLQQAEAPRF